MSDTDDIVRRRSEFVEAFNRQDQMALAGLVTQDHTSMPPNQPSFRGIDTARRFWRERFAVAKSRFSVSSTEEVEVLGDVAIDQFNWSMDSVPFGGGKTVHDQGKCIWIWRRPTGGAWQVARAIWNSELPQGGLWSGAPPRLS